MERDLTLPTEEIAPSIPVEFRLATPHDIDSLTPEEHGYDAARRLMAKESLERGDLCTIAVHQGKIVHVGWISFREFEFAGVRFALGPGRSYNYDVRTPEKYQRMGLHRAGNNYRNSVTRERGGQRKIAWVDVRNHVPLRNNIREGYRIIGTMWRAQLLRRWRFSSRPAWLAPYLLGKADMPEVRVPVPRYPDSTL